LAEQADSGKSVVTWVSEREIMSLLSKHLAPQEKAVLECLADGLGAREIGRELRLSHTMVIRYRRKIAAILIRFGFSARSASETIPAIAGGRVNGSKRAVRLCDVRKPQRQVKAAKQ
jgi:DNA-binding CsgD family transcriptional regulator